ncbi:MAG: hypothetical protein ACR2QO_16120 [Acidimicrobiales bacterium]
MDITIDLGNVDWETVIVSGTTAFMAALVASVTAMRLSKRQRRHDLEDRWAEIRAEILQEPLPGVLDQLRTHLAGGVRAVDDARRQIESVARSASGLPVAERRRYVAPLTRGVTELEALDHELESASAAAHGAASSAQVEQYEADYAETLGQLVTDLGRFDEHLQATAAAGRRRSRWLPFGSK